MKFEEMFAGATLLTDDFLKNECAYELSQLNPKQRETAYKTYYINTCAAVNELLYLHPSPQMVEQLLENPVLAKTTQTVSYLCGCTIRLNTKIMDAEQRRYLYKMAMYDQLVFDISNGRTSMLRGEDKKWLVAPDALAKLDMLGFCQRTYAVKW